jgi:hypothetical protein
VFIFVRKKLSKFTVSASSSFEADAMHLDQMELGQLADRIPWDDTDVPGFHEMELGHTEDHALWA